MKLKLLALVMSLIVVGAIGVSWQRLTTAETAPVGLAVAPDNQNLGRVKYGEIPTADFEVRNGGQEAMQITRISTSCGCTTATLVGSEAAIEAQQPVTLGGGESRIMRVAFNPATHGDDTDLGQVKRVIYITTNNQDQPEVQATIEAEVYK